MTDRVPGAPGQFQAQLSVADLQKLQSGEAFTITLKRDDQPLTEGTPYSKAAVLPDALAAKLCPNVEDPTPADAFQALHERIYPVGAIYLSVLPTDPAALFGGTWERLKDRFLLGAGDTYAAGAAGGEAMHTLTEAEIPAHKHGETMGVYGYTGWELKKLESPSVAVKYSSEHYISAAETTHASTVGSNSATANTGGGQAHNNMPPYLAVYMWKRVA